MAASDSSSGNGELKKLQIIACKDDKYEHDKAPDEDKLEVLYNPDKLEEGFEIEYYNPKIDGKSQDKIKYARVKSGDINLEFLIDGTGATKSKLKDVMEQVDQLKRMGFSINSETHEPRFLVVVWGKILIKARMKSAKFTYTLFNTEGKPLRVKVNVILARSTSDQTATKLENKNSPDLTHYRTVKAGDTLPLMTKEIYGKTSYYLEVARVNNLKSFTNLKPGDSIYFPPIDKTTA